MLNQQLRCAATLVMSTGTDLLMIYILLCNQGPIYTGLESPYVA